MEDVNVVPAAAMMEYTTSGNHTSKNANGNIITLTLKNNHLIVETEERAVRVCPCKRNIGHVLSLQLKTIYSWSLLLSQTTDIYSN